MNELHVDDSSPFGFTSTLTTLLTKSGLLVSLIDVHHSSSAYTVLLCLLRIQIYSPPASMCTTVDKFFLLGVSPTPEQGNNISSERRQRHALCRTICWQYEANDTQTLARVEWFNSDVRCAVNDLLHGALVCLITRKPYSGWQICTIKLWVTHIALFSYAKPWITARRGLSRTHYNEDREHCDP
ncbi:hypothetical protein AB1N83_013701 [Pleurotus pulmonarius]